MRAIPQRCLSVLAPVSADIGADIGADVSEDIGADIGADIMSGRYARVGSCRDRYEVEAGG